MDARTLALELNCNDFEKGSEILPGFVDKARAAGLLIVYGHGVDTIELAGAINETMSEGIILLVPAGHKVSLTDEDEGETWEEGGEGHIAVQLSSEADWESHPNSFFGELGEDDVWRFETSIPHHTFNIHSGDQHLCVGMVVDMEEMKGREDGGIRQRVFEALGMASMCWKDRPTGEVDSERAVEVGEGLIQEIEKYAQTYSPVKWVPYNDGSTPPKSGIYLVMERGVKAYRWWMGDVFADKDGEDLTEINKSVTHWLDISGLPSPV